MREIIKVIRSLKRSGIPFDERKTRDEHSIRYPSEVDCRIAVSSVKGERAYLYVLDKRNGLDAYTATAENVLKAIYGDTRWNG